MRPLAALGLALALALALATSARAEHPGPSFFGGLVRCTPTLVVPPGAAVRCFAVAETPPTEPIYVLIARLMANKNQDVTQWGYAFSAAPGVRSIGYYAEELTESTSPKSRYCQVAIDPADATLAVSFEVRFAGEQFAQATTLGPCPENNGQPK